MILPDILFKVISNDVKNQSMVIKFCLSSSDKPIDEYKSYNISYWNLDFTSTGALIDSIRNQGIITIVNELSLTIGLVMLTIGNFLGGMWANESWGRYWGWDPKETWALISILIYAFVLHMRLIPKLRGNWLFNLMSIVAFASIMMTYFGVNFYLVGLHSYASGDKVITPNFVYWSIVTVFILGTLSKYKYNKHLVK